MRAKPLAFALVLVAGCADIDPTTVDTAPQFSEASPFAGEVATIGWQARARALVTANPMSPFVAARMYAALSVAQYDAVTSINDDAGTLPEDGFGTGGRSVYEAKRGAIAGASARVLSFFFPSAAASLEQQVITEANAGAGDVHPQFTAGVAAGRTAGDASIQHVQADGFTTPWTGTVPVGPGLWIANGPPAGVTLVHTMPYFMTTGSQFRPAPPPAYQSPEFNTALAEVSMYSQNRTPEQVAFSRAWNYGPGTPTPPGYFNNLAAGYSVEHHLDETATAEVFAVMHAAAFDALIGCWDAKYHYWVMRPSQVDPSITLPIGLPNHPSYPSGHSCLSAAAGTVLTHFFPSHAGELSAIVADAGFSRILAGIHYRFDITAGNAIGRSVGQLAIERGF